MVRASLQSSTCGTYEFQRTSAAYKQRLADIESLRYAPELTPFQSPSKRKRADQPAFDVIKPVQ